MKPQQRAFPSTLRTPGLLAVFAGLALATSSPAQIGSYKTYGTGCGQSVRLPGPNANLKCTSFASLRSRDGDRYAISCRENASRLIHGATLRVQNGFYNIPVALELWLADSVGRPQRRVGVGLKLLSRTAGLQSIKLTTPYFMRANTNYAIVLSTPRNGVLLPICANGTRVQGYRWQAGAWRSMPANWIYRVDTGIVMRRTALSGTREPAIGRPLTVAFSNARPNSIAAVYFGASNTQWGALRLPFSLNGFGATGCSLLASRDMSFVTRSDASGRGTIVLSVPSSQSLIGLRFFNQAMVHDPAANAFGWSFSNGGEGTVGIPCVPSARTSAGARLAFGLPRVDFFGFPGVSIAGNYTGTKQRICCRATGRPVCSYSGAGNVLGKVGQFSIPVTSLGKVIDDINAKICSTLNSASAGAVTCSSLMGISVNGIEVKGNVRLLRDDCRRISQYSSTGSVKFPGGVFGGVDVSAEIKLLLASKKFSFKLGLTAVPEGSWKISNNRASMTLKIKSVRATGTVTLPLVNKPVGIDVSVATPTLTVTTPAVTLPRITIGC